MKKNINLLAGIIMIFALSACYPGGAEYVDELDTSISHYDDEFGWNNLDGNYYYLPDEILHIKNGEVEEDPDETHDADILAQVNSHLEAQGLMAATAGVDTTLSIAIILIEQNYSGAAWIPGGGWWGGYYPWNPGWGWGGYYPWYPVYYSYQTGSVLIEMAGHNLKFQEEPPLVYSGVLDGLIQGSKSYVGGRIERGIDELFTQAPFE